MLRFHPATARRRLTTAWLILAAVSWPAHADPSLYDRLGGQSGVATVVSELVERMRTDPVSGHLFRKVNHKRLKAKIADQICTLTGGPCTFDGDDMETTHAGLPITETDFYRLVEQLVAILDGHGIGAREKNELLAILAPLKRDVVTQ